MPAISGDRAAAEFSDRMGSTGGIGGSFSPV
jgi:hypothetical protein